MQLIGLLTLLLHAPEAYAQAQAAPQATPQAAPGPVIVWLDPQAPDERNLARAEKLVGGTVTHYGAAELAFPPQPWTKKDSELLGNVGKAQREAQKRWEEFDVEKDLARGLHLAIEGVTVMRDTAERDTVALGLLWEGAAVNLAFSPEEFKTSLDAQSYRLSLPGLAANRAFVDMIALDPGRRYGKGEMPEGSSFGVIGELTETLASLPSGTLTVGTLPPMATLFINGQPVPLGDSDSLTLLPGHYWVHLLINNVICGRAEFDMVPGASLELPRMVTEGERAEAERLVEVENLSKIPGAVSSAVGLIAAQHPASPVFIAAVTPDGTLSLLPYSGGARLAEKNAVTFGFGAELGGGMISTPYLWYGDPQNLPGPGEMITVPAASAGLDLELGFYNLAVLAGADLNITPTAAFVYGTGESDATPDDNLSTQLTTRVHGGVGVYALRPTHNRKPTLLFGATYGWFSPGFLGPSGRITFGIPIDRRNWFRITATGTYSQPMNGFPEDGPLISAGLRLGFQSAL